MKLLIITQKVDKDDTILGFFHEWIREFAKNCQQVIVVCLEQGDYDLPDNVKILSLGKETKVSRLSYLVNFYRYIYLERNNYDKVFVHMNQIYVILGFLVWKISHKKISLWYTHKAVTFSLRLATFLTDVIFTASAESFRIKSHKVNVVGHGIDTTKLVPVSDGSYEVKQDFSIITVGRISRVKNQRVLVEAVEYLKRKGIIVNLVIIGGPVTSDDVVYLNQLQGLVRDFGLESVIFLGSLSHEKILYHLHKSDLFVNLSDTGSLDKAVLEAVASGILVISSNKAFRSILEPFDLSLNHNNSAGLAEKIADIKNNPDEYKKSLIPLRNIVAENHDLKKLIKKINLILCNK